MLGGSKLMNSKRVACGFAFLANCANLTCIAIHVAMHSLCLLNLDGGRNTPNIIIMQNRQQVRSIKLAHSKIVKSSFPLEHLGKVCVGAKFMF